MLWRDCESAPRSNCPQGGSGQLLVVGDGREHLLDHQRQAVVLVVGGGPVGGGDRLRHGVAHGHTEPGPLDQLDVVAGIAGSHHLGRLEAEERAQPGNPGRLGHAGALDLEERRTRRGGVEAGQAGGVEHGQQVVGGEAGVADGELERRLADHLGQGFGTDQLGPQVALDRVHQVEVAGFRSVPGAGVTDGGEPDALQLGGQVGDDVGGHLGCQELLEQDGLVGQVDADGAVAAPPRSGCRRQAPARAAAGTGARWPRPPAARRRTRPRWPPPCAA